MEKFQGPLSKLLELIEAKKMEITEISLAEVTDDFLKYLQTLSEADLRLVADFIAVASRLILIKSKFLLPDLSLTGEEEAEIRDLEKRLKIYQELKPMLKNISHLWRGGNREISRPYFLVKGLAGGGGIVFYPGSELGAEGLLEAMAKVFESFKGLELESKTIKEKIVTIEEKIKEIIDRIKQDGEANFKSLSNKKKTRSEIIAIFLAILHLARAGSFFGAKRAFF